MKKARALLVVATILAAGAARADQTNAQYIAKLRSTYGGRLHFESAEAERIVRSFNIDCRARDGRYLPLINVLYVRLSQSSSKTIWLETDVQERGGEVRIVDTVRGPKARPVSEVSFEINKWGELRPIGITAEAVLNSCYGSYGPIWQQ